MAYPPLILASTAAAFGWEVTVFHPFWGLDILHKERSENLLLSSVGNPNMPVPNAIGALPGMDSVTTTMMQRRIEDDDTATIEELIETSLDTGVEFRACRMTIDLMGYGRSRHPTPHPTDPPTPPSDDETEQDPGQRPHRTSAGPARH